MAGHSKWANIKFRKERQDAKKGKVFTKLIKEITVAARSGGGDPVMNARLRQAIQVAKQANMPAKNIENAIKKGTGEMPGVIYEEINYEGYGPGGVALFIECMTDNKNRTVGEVRHILSKHGGNLGESGCVGWMFDRKGLIRVEKENYDEEELLMVSIEAGEEDLKVEDEVYEIFTAFEDLETVRTALEEQGITIKESETTRVPQNYVPIEGKDAEKMLKMLDSLEDNDDVQNVFANFDMDENVMESLSNE